jgi:hypothetical protein
MMVGGSDIDSTTLHGLAVHSGTDRERSIAVQNAGEEILTD